MGVFVSELFHANSQIIFYVYASPFINLWEIILMGHALFARYRCLNLIKGLYIECVCATEDEACFIWKIILSVFVRLEMEDGLCSRLCGYHGAPAIMKRCCVQLHLSCTKLLCHWVQNCRHGSFKAWCEITWCSVIQTNVMAHWCFALKSRKLVGIEELALVIH